MGDVPAGTVFVHSIIHHDGDKGAWLVLYIGRSLVLLRSCDTYAEVAATRTMIETEFKLYGYRCIF